MIILISKKPLQQKLTVYLKNASEASLSPAEKIVVDSRHLVSVLYFPLLLKENAIGAFIVGTTGKIRQFTENEIDLCNILSFQVSLAVANAQLYKKAQQAIVDLTHAYDATLEGWSRVLDMRDHVTDEHTHRVADLTVALASKMGIPESDLEIFGAVRYFMILEKWESLMLFCKNRMCLPKPSGRSCKRILS